MEGRQVRRRWAFLCLLGAVFQILTFLAASERRLSPSGETGLPRSEWEDLSHALLACWAELWPERADLGADTVHSEGLLKRETSLLELVDIEEQLRVFGMETHLATEARNWIESSKRISLERSGESSSILAQLVRWCEACLGEGFTSGRLLLFPGRDGAFPDLQFEFGGDMERSARFLERMAHELPGMQLAELELREEASTQRWWILGRYQWGEDLLQ